ncbi:hypothetical protein NQD34_014591 [Periophthalmus magnuspinnatus]|nr:hypothetical protein NQD34_014591 [Periophthalmus magnuspinnatus]
MQCVKIMRKRPLDLEPWDRCKTKRVCLGAELVADCPMETCDSSNLTNQLQPQPHVQLKPNFGPGLGPGLGLGPGPSPGPGFGPGLGPGLVCQRCLRGEPGHINHILGL